MKHFSKQLCLLLAVLLCLCVSLVGCSEPQITDPIYVTIAVKGELVLTYEAVTLEDKDGDGALTINDALQAAHDAYFDGTDGYASAPSEYGLSLNKLWGDTSGVFSYMLNDASVATSLAEPVKVGDHTNCEFDTARAFEKAGADTEIFVVKNMSADAISRSVETFAEKIKESQIIFIPGGFSGGDEPDGSGKFITAFFRNAAIKEEVTRLLENRDGLMCGICNGFQALVKLGLVPYGKIIDTDENCPTLTFNVIGRHQSRIVRTRVASNNSPWLANTNVGDVYNVAISHGEGRFFASEELARQLIANGQVATQYVDLDGNATADVRFNPNGSIFAIEGITSPDGRVFGKMGHSERIGSGLYKNVPGNYDIRMFEAAVKYFK